VAEAALGHIEAVKDLVDRAPPISAASWPKKTRSGEAGLPGAPRFENEGMVKGGLGLASIEG